MTESDREDIHRQLEAMLKPKVPLTHWAFVVPMKGEKPVPWEGKEAPKERARRLWAKKGRWHRKAVMCFREGETGCDGCS